MIDAELFDELNAQLLAVEECFTARFEISAFVALPQGKELWFKKRSQAWVLCVEPLVGEAYDLTHASLATRLDAARVVRDLYAALVEAQTQTGSVLAKVVQDTREFVAELQSTKGTP